MKNLFLLLFVLIISTQIKAQLELPRVSPKASVSQTVGYCNITVEYYRPAVKGRDIWGALVPFGQIWRTGANDATTIQFTTNVSINGMSVPAGMYSLFTIPEKDEWTIILNKTFKQWGAYNYKSDDDLLRFTVKPVVSEFNERLLFSFTEVSDSTATLSMSWDKLKVSFSIKEDIYKHAHQKIKDALSQNPDKADIHNLAVRYAADNSIFLDEAAGWADKAVSLGGGYVSHFQKARVLYASKNYVDALKSLAKCRETGRNEKNYQSFVSQIDFLEKQINSAMK
jgi:tetratricopeptide (TPR) repeat protein